MNLSKKTLGVLFFCGLCVGLMVFAVQTTAQEAQKDQTQPQVIQQDKADIDLTQTTKTDTADKIRWIGVRVAALPDILVSHFKAHGNNTGLVIVDDVVPNGPASKAGLKPGDIILQFAGKEVNSPADLVELVTKSKAEAQPMTVIRDGAKQTVTVTPIDKTLNELAQGMHRVNPAFLGMPNQEDIEQPNLPPGMKLGPEVIIGDARKMMQEMQGLAQKMLGAMPENPSGNLVPRGKTVVEEDEESLILPKTQAPGSTGQSKHLAISSSVENGKTKIHVTQVIENDGKTDRKEWDADKIEDLPADIQNDVKALLPAFQ